MPIIGHRLFWADTTDAMTPMKLISATLATALVAGLATGCKPTSNSAPAAKPASKATPAAAAKPAVRSWDTMKMNAFLNEADCGKAGYKPEQCQRGESVAAAMMDMPGAIRFPTQSACQVAFKECSLQGGKEKGYAPKRAGFSLGDEKPGDPPPSKEHPAYYAPIFQIKSGDIVVTSETRADGTRTAVVAIPVSGNPGAKLAIKPDGKVMPHKEYEDALQAQINADAAEAAKKAAADLKANPPPPNAMPNAEGKPGEPKTPPPPPIPAKQPATPAPAPAK